MAYTSADPLNSYRIYVIGCWQNGVDAAGESIWRFSLERNGAEEQRRGFEDLVQLFTYLHVELMGQRLEKPVVPFVDQVGASPKRPEL